MPNIQILEGSSLLNKVDTILDKVINYKDAPRLSSLTAGLIGGCAFSYSQSALASYLLQSKELSLAITPIIATAGAFSSAVIEILTREVVNNVVKNATELADAARSDIESGKIIKQD